MSQPTFLLVDGTAMAYRAFYAIQGLSTRGGRPTNAVYGFIRLLDQLRARWNPTHLLVTFDRGLPAERLALLPTYKAQREAMPDPLRQQFTPIEQYLDAARMAWLALEGVEADDVMAAYAHAARPVAEVLLATSDKDMFQLVGEGATIVSLTKVGERMGPAEVRAKTGVAPAQIVEWLALTGDSADNIPGVPGVGPKTAAKLLQQFGSLDALWLGLDQVPSERLRGLLRDHRDAVERNVKMARLRSDLPLPMDWREMTLRRPDTSKLIAVLEELEFDSMARKARADAELLF